jgi:hypothetical protein
MIETIPYKAAHAHEIVATHRSVVDSGIKFGDEVGVVADFMESCAKSATYMVDGRIVGCGGICVISPGEGEAWALYVADIGQVHIDPKIPKKRFWQWIEELKLTRVQAPIRDGFERGEQYARFLGFDFEETREDYYGPGNDAKMWVIKREVR